MTTGEPGPTPAQLAAANLVEVDTYQQIELAAAHGYPPRTYDPVAKNFPPIVKAYVSKNYQNPPTPVPTPLKVGIGTQSSLLRWPWNPNNASALQLAQQMGAKYFRADVGWNWSNGSWTSLCLADGVTLDPQAAVKINVLNAECAQYGLELILVVSGAWASTYSPGLSGNVPNSGYNTNYPCTPQQFADAMSWLVAQCPGLHWEIGNELDRYQYGSGIALLMNPALYIEILSLCYPAMKTADPSCVVHLGPVGNINQGGSGWNWLAGLYKNSVTPHSLKDVLSIHLYPGPTNCPYLDGNLWGPDLNIQYLEYQAFLDSVGETAATWITEIGWPSVTTNSSDVFPEMTPQLQAQYTTDFLNAFNELGPEVIILFSLGDAPGAGLFYGQVSGAGPYTPKPVFAAIQALTK